MEPSQQALTPQYSLEKEDGAEVILIPFNELAPGVSILITSVPPGELQIGRGRTPGSKNVRINSGRLHGEVPAQRVEIDSPAANVGTDVVYEIGEHGRRAVMGQEGLEWREREREDEVMISSGEEQRRRKRKRPLIQELDSEDERSERDRSRRSQAPSVSPTRGGVGQEGPVAGTEADEGYHLGDWEGDIIIGYNPGNSDEGINDR